MKECGRAQRWYIFETKSDEKKEELVSRHNIKSVGVYIRRHVILLAWYGAFMKILAKKRVLKKRMAIEERNKLFAKICLETNMLF